MIADPFVSVGEFWNSWTLDLDLDNFNFIN